MIQEHTPPQMLGRVFGALTALAQAGIPIGAVLAGVVVQQVGLVPTILGMGAIYLAVKAIDTTTPTASWSSTCSPPWPSSNENLIRERTSAELAAARARGRRGGRPSVLTAHKLQVAREMYASRQYIVAVIAKTVGVSRASIYRHVTRAGG